MSHEQDLHDTATELRQATFRLARRLRAIRAYDAMSDAQLAVLSGLRLHGRHTLSALAERERVTAPSMSALVTGLEEQGFVRRIPDADDRRRVQIEITPTGEEIVVATIAHRDALLSTLMAEHGFTDDELGTLRAASALMRKVAER